jgi:hypothetical protein
MAYYLVEPFGEYPAWVRSGVVSSVIANVHRSRKSARRFSPEDFMPREPENGNGSRVQKQSVEEQRIALLQIYSYAKKHNLTKEQ